MNYIPYFNIDSLIVRHSEQFISSKVGSDLIMMNKRTGDYVVLNTVSANIWDKLEYLNTVRQLVDSLIQEYEVSASVCEHDTIMCIQNMLNHELVYIAT